MPVTPNLEIEIDVSGHVPMQRTVQRIADALDGGIGIPDAIVSAGEALTIPAGSTLAEALQILADAIDPDNVG